MSFLLRNWAKLYTNLTRAERALEPAIAALGGQYRAQHPFFDLGIIVDFALLDRKTVVEVDGKSHLAHEQKIKDIVRSLALMDRGWRVVRIWNEEALRDPAGALSRALRASEETREDLEGRLRYLESVEPLRPPATNQRYLKLREKQAIAAKAVQPRDE